MDSEKLTWSRLPSMLRKRQRQGCGVIHGGGVSEKVVLAGGYDVAAKAVVNTVDILDLATLKWSAGYEHDFSAF